MTDANFAKQLACSGLIVESGPFKFLIRSAIPAIAQNLACLYAGQSEFASKDVPSVFFDFVVSIDLPNGIRSLFHKQAQFYLDDRVIFNPFPLHHATAMLEWGMNWCISTQIHTYLIIHAAVIERDGFAAVLPAPPGSGKSTLCAALVQEGWRLLSDELTLIDLSNGYAVPMPRPIGLKNQSIQILANRYPQAVFGALSSDTLKGSVCHLKPPIESIAMQKVVCPIAWIVFPQYLADAETDLCDKPKGESFMALADNAFNYSHLGTVAFDILKQVVDRAACHGFTYSQLDEAIAVFNRLEARDAI
ncbi:HprK-related kinase A [Methylomonas albis]|uniref:HprK-related kinase A n=1 Tax=Methylomonas albis TaxID=1854563 RepID=A0ABR9D3R4_9GAMM|nr:HprK-related kinase A [Methylomonas albis]MBD9357767.1 HprK-related kinase A [Methylomonas albis]